MAASEPILSLPTPSTRRRPLITLLPQVRRLDIILAPTDIYAHAVIGWSCSTGFQRSLAEYAKKAHEGNWKHVPDSA